MLDRHVSPKEVFSIEPNDAIRSAVFTIVPDGGQVPSKLNIIDTAR